MKKSVLILAATLTMGISAHSAFAQTTGDTTKKTTTTATTTTQATASGDIASVLNGTTFGNVLTTSKLDSVIKGPGPYTVFAPDNGAFTKLSPAKQDSLLKDPVKLSAVVKKHVIVGKYTKTDIIKALQAGKGSTTLKTVDGQSITLSVSPAKQLVLTDSEGNTSQVVSFDAMASNGVVHGVNAVLTK